MNSPRFCRRHGKRSPTICSLGRRGSIHNWRATIAPDVHATTQISKALCPDRQWVDPSRQPSFSRALASLIRLGYLKTVSLVPITDLEGDPPDWLHHLSDGVHMRVPRKPRLHVRRSLSENPRHP
jgi:hypothetical protein